MSTKRKLLLIAYIIVIFILVFTAPACTKKEETPPKCDESEFHDARFDYLQKINTLTDERNNLTILLGSTAGACFIREYKDEGEDYYKLGIMEDRVVIFKRTDIRTIDNMVAAYVWRPTKYDLTVADLLAYKRIDCKKVPR